MDDDEDENSTEYLHKLIEQFLVEEVLPEGMLENEDMAGTFIIGMTPNSLQALLHGCFNYIEDTMQENLDKKKEEGKIPNNATIH